MKIIMKCLLFMLASLIPLHSLAADYYDGGTIYMSPGETKTISNSGGVYQYSHHSGFDWSWETWPAGSWSGTVVPGINIVSSSINECTIKANSNLKNCDMELNFKFNYWLYSQYTGANKAVYNFSYLIKYKEPDKVKVTANPSSGSVDKGTKVYLTPSVSGATIYYTTDGTTPTKSSTLYTSSGVTIDKALTLKAIAYKSGYESEVGTWNYTVKMSIPINEENFPDANFRNYLLQEDYGKDGVITETEIGYITNIQVSNKNISSLKGIENFTNLHTLSCFDNPMTTLDVSNNTALKELYCGNQLTSLDVSKNTALEKLGVFNNKQLSSLDVSKNTALKVLRCYDNKLTTLDVSNNTALTELDCSHNLLTTLDVSKNTAMTSLDCRNNELTTLDLSKNTELAWLNCEGNIMSTLEMSRNIKLAKIYCAGNKLTSLDLSNHTVLEYVECQLNQLSSLDVSNCTKLIGINCCANRISGTAMDKLINSLPYKTGYFRVISTSTINGGLEQNVCNTEQVAAVKAKGWIPQYSTFSFSTGWQEYGGSAIVEPYAVLSNDGKTVTFYYDDKKESRGGVDINNKSTSDDKPSPYGTATTAIFDASFANYRPTSTAYWFYKCSELTTIKGMENLYTDNVTDVSYMFGACYALTSLDLSKFNTSNVTDMRGMFSNCNALTSLDVSRFNTSKVTDMSGMFSSCVALTSLDLSNFDTRNVTTMYAMFYHCDNLTSLYIEGFNTEKVTNMKLMFTNCFSLKKLDVSDFKMDNVTNANRMFAQCHCLTTLDLSSFNTSNVKDMTRMFGGCKSLTTIYVNEKKWSTANVTEGDGVFAGCTVLVGGNGTKFDETHTDVEYARIDKAGSPGYFTDIADSKVTGITLYKTTLSLQTNQAETLTATVMPDNALDKTVTWSSSNTRIATVDDNGKVTAVSAGTATITCTAKDGSNVKATCEVTVTNPKPEKITLPAEATVKAGETTTLTPTMTPENAEATLTWTSDDETVATVDANGVVKGIKKGQTFINVTTDNGKYGWCKVTVTAAEPTTISLPSTMTVYVGGTVSLTPTLTPADAETVLAWMSYDETIATVDGNGIVSGLKEGLTVITATTANGISSNPCKVTVKTDPTGITNLRADGTAISVYTLSGQKLKAPRKGLNIVGGKKIIVK